MSKSIQSTGTYFNHFIWCGLFVLLACSCQSPEKQADSAFDILKQKKEMRSDSTYLENIHNPETLTTTLIQKIEIQDEWQKFKTSSEKKISANDQKIDQITKMKNVTAKTIKQTSRLKTENNDFRRMLDNYKEEEKVRWENFKTSLDHDINTVEIELKDLSINTKK